MWLCCIAMENQYSVLFTMKPLTKNLLGIISLLLKNEILFLGCVAHSPVTVMTILTQLLDLNTILQKIKWKEA